jgi:hypothetical protein
VPVNQFLEIREGADRFDTRKLPPPFAIGGGS